jgi:hypothetical protein
MYPDSQVPSMTGTTYQSFEGFNNSGNLCPVLENLEPDCYCLDMTSRKIPNAVKFCLGDFRKCDIYQRVMKADEVQV